MVHGRPRRARLAIPLILSLCVTLVAGPTASPETLRAAELTTPTTTLYTGPIETDVQARTCLTAAVQPEPTVGQVRFFAILDDGTEVPLEGATCASESGIGRSVAYTFDSLGPRLIVARYEAVAPYEGSESEPTVVDVFGHHVDMWSDADPVLADDSPIITFYVVTEVGPISGAVALFDTTGADPVFVDVIELDVDESGRFGHATFVLEPTAPGTYALEGDYLGSDTHEPAWAAAELVVHEALVAGPVVVNGGDPTTTESIVSVDAPATGSLRVELSPDGVHWWPSFVGEGPYPVNLMEFGGGDGTYTVRARWIDQLGDASEVQSDSIILDTLAPTGSVVVADGATYAGVQTTVDLAGVDLGTGVVEAQLSNDGLTWTTVANANDVAWTLDTGCAPCRVWARWKDGIGRWSTPVSDSVSLDATPPYLSLSRTSYAVAAPTVTFTAASSDRHSGVATIEASNDGVRFVSIPNGTPTTWSLIDPATGGHDADGSHTVTIRAIDHVGNVSIRDLPFMLDRVAPVVTLDAATYATASTVQVTAGASDATSGMASLELSNDGIHWATIQSFTFLSPPTIGGSPRYWSLTDAATGGTDADGQHTIYARARDRAGNVAVREIAVILDRVAPVAGPPVMTVPGGGSLVGTAMPVRVSWTGSDATSGVARYEMQRQVDGVWKSAVSSLAGPSVVAGLATNHSYRFRVRAIDRAGNAGGWVTGQALRIDGFQESSTRITYRGTWRTGSATGYWGGRDRYSVAAGATARFSVTGKGFAWVAPVGPTRGRARVYVNGVLKQTVNLYSATGGQRRIVYATRWSTSASRTITIRVVGTAGHPRVDLDGIVVWR